MKFLLFVLSFCGGMSPLLGDTVDTNLFQGTTYFQSASSFLCLSVSPREGTTLHSHVCNITHEIGQRFRINPVASNLDSEVVTITSEVNGDYLSYDEKRSNIILINDSQSGNVAMKLVRSQVEPGVNLCFENSGKCLTVNKFRYSPVFLSERDSQLNTQKFFTTSYQSNEGKKIGDVSSPLKETYAILDSKRSLCLDTTCGKVSFEICDASNSQTFTLRHEPNLNSFSLVSNGHVIHSVLNGSKLVTSPDDEHLTSKQYFVVSNLDLTKTTKIVNLDKASCLTKSESNEALLNVCYPNRAPNTFKIVPIDTLTSVLSLPMRPIDFSTSDIDVVYDTYYVPFVVNGNQSSCLKLIDGEIRTETGSNCERPEKIKFELTSQEVPTLRISYQNQYFKKEESKIVLIPGDTASSITQMFTLSLHKDKSRPYPMVQIKPGHGINCLAFTATGIQVTQCQATTNQMLTLVPYDTYARKTSERKLNGLQYKPVLPNVPYVLSVTVFSGFRGQTSYTHCFFTIKDGARTGPCNMYSGSNLTFENHNGHYKIKDLDKGLYYGVSNQSLRVSEAVPSQLFDISPVSSSSGIDIRLKPYHENSQCNDDYLIGQAFGRIIKVGSHCDLDECSMLFHLESSANLKNLNTPLVIYAPELDQCLTVKLAKRNSMGEVIMANCNNTAYQSFYFSNYTGVTVIRNQAFGKGLGIKNGEVYDGAPVIASSQFGYDFQKFYLTVGQSGEELYERLVSHKSGLCLTASSDKNKIENVVYQAPCGSEGVQAFQIKVLQTGIRALLSLNPKALTIPSD